MLLVPTVTIMAMLTAGVLMHAMLDGTYVIEHVVRGQWSALEREEKIKFWAKQDRSLSPGRT